VAIAHTRPDTRSAADCSLGKLDHRQIQPDISIRTPSGQTARILHATARHFVLCPAYKCQSATNAVAYRIKKYLISLTMMVGAQGIEPWTSLV
jgi:hypothetical protein